MLEKESVHIRGVTPTDKVGLTPHQRNLTDNPTEETDHGTLWGH
jgi:hypothetical protein